MRILTLGCGHIGSVMARDLAETLSSAEVTVSDRDRGKAAKIASAIGRDNVHSIQLDVSDHESLVKTLKRFDLAVGLTPGRFGYEAIKASIEAGVDIVDLSFMTEDPLKLSEAALRSGVRVVPDCGVAPGLSNILVGRAVAMLDKTGEVHILVGGLPERPVSPLGYRVTWSVVDLIEEYTRTAKIVEDGKQVEVKALDGLEAVDFPGIGRLEAFYTDGVRTLHESLKGVENMWEKTLRYPGHAEKIKLLIDLGFFDEEPLRLKNVSVAPRELTAALLERRLSRPEVGDLLAMSVEVAGTEGGSEVTHTYHLLDRYDAEKGVTAMARTTAYTASIITQLLARDEIREMGVIPPEKLGMNKRIFDDVLIGLRKRGIKVVHRYRKRS